MVEVDYPHSDSTWPDTQALIKGELEMLEIPTIKDVCYRNAARLYRWPEPPEAVLLASDLGERLLDA
jgi:hypothetical protein